jgi:hypothetical protein
MTSPATSPATSPLFVHSTSTARRSLAALAAGIALWAVHLGAIFLGEELLQRAGDGDDMVIGLRLDELVVLAATVVPAIVTVVLALEQARVAATADRDPERLLAIVSALINALMSVAIVAEGIVVLFLPGSR